MKFLSSAALACTSAALAAQSPPIADYPYYAKVAEEQLSGEVPKAADLLQSGEYHQEFICVRTAEDGPLWKQNAYREAMREIAQRVAFYRRDLRVLGYPDGVVDQALAAYERTSLQRLSRRPSDIFDRPAEPTLETALNRFAARQRNAVPRVALGNDCGGTEILPLRVVIVRPLTAKAFLIPVFYSKVCEAKHIQVSDIQRCDGWFEVKDGERVKLDGEYVSLVRWPSGRTETSPRRLGPPGAIRFGDAT